MARRNSRSRTCTPCSACHDGTTRGGHLLEGHVWPTLEVVVREAPAQLRKTLRPDIGLALIDLG